MLPGSARVAFGELLHERRPVVGVLRAYWVLGDDENHSEVLSNRELGRLRHQCESLHRWRRGGRSSRGVWATATKKVEESAELTVRVSSACFEFDRQHRGLGIKAGAIWCPPVGEETHAVPGNRVDVLVGQQRRQFVDGVAAGVEPQAVDLVVGIERGERGGPVARECWSHRQDVGVLRDDRHDGAGAGQSGERRDHRGGFVEIHEHAMTQHAAEALSAELCGCVFAGCLHDCDATSDIGILGGDELLGSVEHGRRRIDDGDVVAGLRERDDLMPRATTDIDDAQGRRRQMRSQMRVDDVGPNAPAQRSVMPPNELLSERRPCVLVHNHHHVALPATVREMTGLAPTQLDRAAGALVGLAAGDALGAGYEFGPAFSTTPEMIGGGIGHWDPGEWTDDTQMALCIAEVTATGRCDLDAIGDRFLDWLAGGPSDVGIQTRAVLSGAEHGTELPARGASHFERNPRGAAGNGSLMRTAPVRARHLGNDEAIADAAMAVSLLTHGDPLAGEACVVWCIAIDRAIREGRLDGVNDGVALLPSSSRDRWREIIDLAQKNPPDSFSPNGFVVTAFQAAYAAICQTPIPEEMPCLHLQRALERAVQIGHDTDTVAAIAGQLLGARWGGSAVPLRWRRLLHGWPNSHSRDLTRLAVLSVRGGKPDAHGWPGVERMVPHYRRDFGATGESFALADDRGVRLGDAATVENDDSDVVISLCRTGTSDIREGAEHFEVWLIDEADPGHNPNLEFILRDVATTVAQCRDEGKSVLLHCVRAESRTPTVAAAYLCERLALTAEDALGRVSEVLPRMNPNAGFRAALERMWPSR